MAEQRNPVQVVIKCQSLGFGFDLTAELTVNQIPGLIGKLRDAGIEPANSPYVWVGQPAHANATQTAPLCPIHGVCMKESKHKAGEYYCSVQIGTNGDGKKVYCQEKVSA